MTPEYWQKVVQIFTDARQMKSSREREDFLLTQCNGEPDLLIEVKKLLTGEDKDQSAYFDEPLFGTNFDVDKLANALEGNNASEGEGEEEELEDWIITDTLIGKYKILNKIGSGGMGIVYEAMQEHPQRVVALKMMKQSVGSRKAARRFRYEVDILGKLQHKNIAQIYEAGVYHYDSSHENGGVGIPYFAMELIVDAHNIIDYAQSNKLNTRQRLELFCAVCDGVQHGHQNGIIHRDLKPSNILVGSDGQPKIIDFGVAKAIGGKLDISTLQTDSGKLIGTVQYMSPEQCDVGQTDVTVDTRSDVYTLGIILYQLLCDKLPYLVADSSLIAAARSVCDAVITHPATEKHNLKGDLAAIILNALSRYPIQRYLSAGELGKDIHRHLKGEIISARNPALKDYALKFIKSHPIFTTITTCLVLGISILSGSMLSTWYFNHRPSFIKVDSDTDTAQLLTYAGDVLKVWYNVRDATLLDLPPEYGEGKLVVIAYTKNSNGISSGKLFYYDAFNPETVVASPPIPVRPDTWQRDWLDQIETKPEDDVFNISNMIATDIFEELPGIEIIVTYSHVPEFMTSINIYNTKGLLLYQRWHKGNIESINWDSQNNNIICTGRRNDWLHNKPDFMDLQLSDKYNIHVLFAVKPDLLTKKGTTIWNSKIGKETGVIWYKYLVPHLTWEVLGDNRIYELAGNNGVSKWHVQFTEHLKSDRFRASLNVSFDPVTGDSLYVIPSNGYATSNPVLPNPSAIKFHDYPPTRDELLKAMTIDNKENN